MEKYYNMSMYVVLPTKNVKKLRGCFLTSEEYEKRKEKEHPFEKVLPETVLTCFNELDSKEVKGNEKSMVLIQCSTPEPLYGNMINPNKELCGLSITEVISGCGVEWMTALAAPEDELGAERAETLDKDDKGLLHVEYDLSNLFDPNKEDIENEWEVHKRLRSISSGKFKTLNELYPDKAEENEL